MNVVWPRARLKQLECHARIRALSCLTGARGAPLAAKAYRTLHPLVQALAAARLGAVAR